MILTCPECGTQYVVKDGAIPPQGRQVRCASCKHSWHQDPELSEAPVEEESVAEAAMIDPSTGPEAEERAYQEATIAAEDQPGDAPVGEPQPVEEPEPPAGYAPVEPTASAREMVEDAPTEPVPPPDYAEPAVAEEPAPPAEEAPADDAPVAAAAKPAAAAEPAPAAEPAQAQAAPAP
ncbi:MAG TPA: MJ0042-type zinc finger domain-containing protein, partial [Sphingomicrobium sp.]|nr:MJ0042-type zinc finger domain-containing protein [Sphingomicrobium sp.]